jgi:1-acyl-sn-glycerol-3-phosphate acyltransferase
MFRIRVEGLKNVPLQGGIILCANHISNHDPVFVGIASPRQIRFMAKQEIFKVPLLKNFVVAVGAFPINRVKPSPAALKQSIEILNSGGCFGIFPEGTRAKGTALQKVHPGTAYLALKTGALVIPVGITGPYRLFRPLVIKFGEPVDLSPFQGAKPTGEILDAASERITAAIGAQLNQPVIFESPAE